jgi:hypothetical protein
VTETDGTWGDAALVPGQAALSAVQITYGDSVSCPAVGDCTAFGGYAPSSDSAPVWVADEVDGAWGRRSNSPSRRPVLA